MNKVLLQVLIKCVLNFHRKSYSSSLFLCLFTLTINDKLNRENTCSHYLSQSYLLVIMQVEVGMTLILSN